MGRRQLDWETTAVLCEELGALAGIGLPWHETIVEACRKLPPRIREGAREAAGPVRQGSDLRAVGIDVDALPRPLVAAIDVSIESGEPALALRQLVPLLFRAAEWTRLLRQAWVYPVVTLVMAFLLWLGLLAWLVPVTADAWGRDGNRPSSKTWLVFLSEHVEQVALAGIGLGSVLGGVLLWRRFGRARRLSLPRTAGRLSSIALFLDLLAVLLESRVPLERSLVLAGALCDDESIMGDAGSLSESVGQQSDGFSRSLSVLPARLGWLLAAADDPGRLANELKMLAREYSMRADASLERVRVWLPIGVLVGIGGSSVLVVVWTVLVPYIRILREAIEWTR